MNAFLFLIVIGVLLNYRPGSLLTLLFIPLAVLWFFYWIAGAMVLSHEDAENITSDAWRARRNLEGELL